MEYRVNKINKILKMYNYKEVMGLMVDAFNAGFNKHDTVEAGLESRETEEEVRWILAKFNRDDGESIKILENDNR